MRLVLNLCSLFVRGSALMLALVAAGAGLGGLGGAFSDRLDAFTHLAPIWLVLGLLGAALAAIFSREGERKALVAIALVGVVAVLTQMAPEVLAAMHRPDPPAKTSSSQVKLVQFNVWDDNDDPQATTAWLLAQKADVVTLVEARGKATPVVKALSAVYPYVLACPYRFGCDVRIFSRWPVIEQHSLAQKDGFVSGGAMTLNHPGGPFTVVAAHLVWPVPAGRQQAQSRLLAARLASMPKDTLILAGDFNSTPWSWSLRRQDKALGLERRTRALASWPSGDFSRLARAPFPVLPIDHVYAGRAWKTVSVERGPALGSDHRPVVAVLAR